MRYSPFLLVDTRKHTSDELKRYVRAEYRERDACWLAAENGNRSCLRPLEDYSSGAVATQRGRPCCDGETPDSRSATLTKSVAARGGVIGNP